MIKESSKIYQYNREGEREFLTFQSLRAYPELKHLFTTRRGGVSEGCFSSWNFGFSGGDIRDRVYHNYEILADTLETDVDHMVTSAQTHTTNVKVITRENAGMGITRKRNFADQDGMVTNETGIAILTAHADCTPVFFYDPVQRVIGMAHSGWKGTLGKICLNMVRTMGENYGSEPKDILAGIGPSLCQDCFEVDIDVAEQFFAVNQDYKEFSYQKGIKYYLDLWKINERILLESGIGPDHISNMELCTKCHNDIFFSHRGQQGKKGIMVGAMMLV